MAMPSIEAGRQHPAFLLVKVLHGVRHQLHIQVQLRRALRRTGLLVKVNKFLVGKVGFGIV